MAEKLNGGEIKWGSRCVFEGTRHWCSGGNKLVDGPEHLHLGSVVFLIVFAGPLM